MMFLLGTHQPSWLDRTGTHHPETGEYFPPIPLFVSLTRLRNHRYYPQPRYAYALDSGAFSELQKHGGWRETAVQFARRVQRIWWQVDRKPDFVAPQDWMCEPIVINGGVAPNGAQFKGTHLSVPEHQWRTVSNYVQLMDMAPHIPWIPVLQGYPLDDYKRCYDLYESAGIDLAALPKVGLGSVCRRQGTDEIYRIVKEFAHLRLHGFGIKTQGLALYGELLDTSDSLAWSERGKHVPGCSPTHKTEANCLPFALRWRSEAIEGIAA